ncbi:MAG TPA: hypothetical protein VNM22_00490 [Candidatus Limnocylindrales bacterium]|nr:hypothetical protein [Candidatus Limnocylindrales bacterium]
MKEPGRDIDVNPEKKLLTPEAFRQILGFAGLELNDQDLEALAPRAAHLLQTIAPLGDMDLADVEPVLWFDILKGG